MLGAAALPEEGDHGQEGMPVLRPLDLLQVVHQVLEEPCVPVLQHPDHSDCGQSLARWAPQLLLAETPSSHHLALQAVLGARLPALGRAEGKAAGGAGHSIVRLQLAGAMQADKGAAQLGSRGQGSLLQHHREGRDVPGGVALWGDITVL